MSVLASATCPSVIGGEAVSASGTFDDLDPASGELLCAVARCGPGEVDGAVAAARAALREWAGRSPADRARILRAIGEAIRGESDELARIESRDTGKPLTQARFDITICARYFDFYASAIETVYGDTIPLGRETLAYTLREPHGVTGHITPWNYPAQMIGRTIAPALAAGNCSVLKPAEEAPLSSVTIAQLALDAGLPAGAFNVVTGLGEEAGAALAAHPGLDHLSFTGSTEVGKLVAAAAAQNVVPVTVELGGKSPNVLFADADLERAVPMIVRSIVQNAGQTCSAGSRLLVERSVHDQVAELVVDRFRSLRLGPGLEDPDVGPLISARQRDRVAGLVAEADGELRIGGGAADGERLRGGFFFEPTVIDRVAPEAPIAQQEVFGPVLVVSAFDDADEAVALANGTRYALVAGIWTTDVRKAHRLARDVEAGQVFVNTFGAGGGVELPFGGRKLSGHGREKGLEGLLGFTRTKTVAIDIG
jgi:aldehyde dehydrogenase (NAD+)/betaine-aldehyde dehydrogenase